MSWEQALFWICVMLFGLPLVGSIGTMLGLKLVDAIARWLIRIFAS